MSTDGERRQRAVMATDAEWERIGRAAKAHGMDRSRFLIHRALMADVLPAEVLRRALREMLVLSLLVVGVQGHAGSGKTTMLREVNALLGEGRIQGLAPSAAAARVLGREAGILVPSRCVELMWHPGLSPVLNNTMIRHPSG